MASLDEFIALALIWTAGIGWGIGFYLIAQGFKAITGEDMGTWLEKEATKIQEKLNEQRLYFPADFGKPTQLFPSLEGTIAGKAADWIHKLGQTIIPGGSKGFLEPVITDMDTLSKQFDPVNVGFEKMNTQVQAVDDSLTTHSLVPSMDLLLASIIKNITQLPLMTLELINVKTAIDAIPNHTTKIVEIKTIRTGDSSGSRGRVQTRTPYGG